MLQGLHKFPVIKNRNVYRPNNLEWVHLSVHYQASELGWVFHSFSSFVEFIETVGTARTCRVVGVMNKALSPCSSRLHCAWGLNDERLFDLKIVRSENMRLGFRVFDLGRHTWIHFCRQNKHWKRKLASFRAEQAFESCFRLFWYFPFLLLLARPRRFRMLSVCLCFSAYN